MEQALRSKIVPGAKIRVTQQVAFRNRAYTTVVEGTVQSFEQRTTGSWYCHAKDSRLWLDRVVLKKSDGEVTTLSLDQFSRVEVLAAPPAAAVEASAGTSA